MDITDTEFSELAPTPPAQQQEFEAPLYKKWFKTRTQAGFISITPFTRDGKFVGRFIVDVGKVNPNNNQVESSTKCFVDAVQLLTYLEAIERGTAVDLFPNRGGVNSAESFIAYGGTAGADPIARVFKIEHWGASGESTGDEAAFAWKCGHFKGNVTNTGAITADMSQPLSMDQIKIQRVEMVEICVRVRLAMHGFTNENPRWYSQ